MIRNALSSLFAVFLFAMGAAGSWYFVQHQMRQASTEDGVESSTILPSGNASSRAKVETSQASGSENEEFMPIPVRGRSMSAEEIVRYGFMYRKNIEEIKLKKKRIDQEQIQLGLLKDDLEQQKMETEGILKQIQHNADRGEQLLAQIQDARRTLEEERKKHEKDMEDIKKVTQVSAPAQRQNVERVAQLLGGMNEKGAADVIKALADKGNMDYALQILDSIEERNASKILDSLDDFGLLAQITEAYREMKRDQTVTKRR